MPAILLTEAIGYPDYESAISSDGAAILEFNLDTFKDAFGASFCGVGHKTLFGYECFFVLISFPGDARVSGYVNKILIKILKKLGIPVSDQSETIFSDALNKEYEEYCASKEETFRKDLPKILKYS